MKRLINAIGLVLFFSSVAFGQMYEGSFDIDVQAHGGKRAGVFNFQRTDEIKMPKYEYMLFPARIDDEYWVERLNAFGDDGWQIVPSISWGAFGTVRILLMRQKLPNE